MSDLGLSEAEAVLDLLRPALAIVGPDLDLDWANAAFRERFPEAVPGVGLAQVPGPWQQARVRRLLREAVLDGTEFDRLEIAGEARAAEQPGHRLTARRLPGRAGGDRLLVLLEPSAEAAQASGEPEGDAVRDLAAQIAHDFNNLLVGMLGHASLAEEALEADSKATRSVRRVQVAARRGVELTNQLLLFSGRAHGSRSPLDLGRLLTEVTRRVREVLPEDATIDLVLAGDLSCVPGDARQLRQILTRVLDNAVEAIGAAGCIDLRAGVERVDRDRLARSRVDDGLPGGRYVVIRIEDDGAGMEPDTLRRACEPFFSTRFSGRGLGLAAALGSMRALGGALEISSPPGRGVSVRLFLPLAGSEAEPPKPPAERPLVRGSGKTLLLVEHEPEVLELARCALEELQLEIVATRDPRECLAIFRGCPERFDAVLVDLNMPGMSGEDLLRELRRIRPDVPAILSSGYWQREDRRNLRPTEPALFLKKPYTPSLLIDRVGAALAGTRRDR